jgi:hypothetical protein
VASAVIDSTPSWYTPSGMLPRSTATSIESELFCRLYPVARERAAHPNQQRPL